MVHNYCNRWRVKANVSKSAVMVFARTQEEGEWMWGEHIYIDCLECVVILILRY